MPFMMATFFGIRTMAKLPVESLTTGGCLWFSDLTIPDPYFILPVVASATILTMIHVILYYIIVYCKNKSINLNLLPNKLF